MRIRSRRRQTINCEPCRKKKQKCNRVKPCSGCILRHCEDACYPDVSEERKEKHFGEVDHEDDEETGFEKRDKEAWYAFKAHESKESTMETMSLALVLPSSLLCDMLIDFAKELLGKTSFLRPDELRQTCTSIVQNSLEEEFGASCKQRRASMLFWTLALAAQNLPQRHALRTQTLLDERIAGQWKSIAERLDRDQEPLPRSTTEAALDEICILTLRALWHSRYGELEHVWYAVGKAIRKGATIGLFGTLSYFREDENVASAAVGRQAFIVGHRLLMLDRWLSFNNIYPAGIAREDLDAMGSFSALVCGSPTLKSTFGVVVYLEQKIIRLFEWGRRVRQSAQSQHADATAERRRNATMFLTYVREQSMEGAAIIRNEFGGSSGGHDDEQTSEHEFRQAEWKSSCAYVACTVSLPFVQDAGAPVSLRRACVSFAVEILRHATTFTRVIKEARRPYRPTRITNQLFSGIRAILVSLLDRDPLGSSDAILLDKPLQPLSTATQDDHGMVSPASRIIDEMHASILVSSPDAPPALQNGQSLSDLVRAGIKCVDAIRLHDNNEVAAKVLVLLNDVFQRHQTLHATLAFPAVQSAFTTAAAAAAAAATDEREGHTAEEVLNALLLQHSSSSYKDDLTPQQMDTILASYFDIS